MSEPLNPQAAVDSAPDVSVVVLTQGDRRAALDEAVASVRRQSGVAVEIVIVWNGVPTDPESSADVDVVLEQNVGIPEGRNRGAEAAAAPIVMFLDDDAVLVSGDCMVQVVALFHRTDRIGIVSLRIVDEDGATAQRHVPRPGGRRPTQPGLVTGFLGGVCFVDSDMFAEIGGFAGEFFYAMEETDLALGAIDAGYQIWYAADLTVRHPRTEPTRHDDAIRRTARNRVWMAHRRLPVLVALMYLLIWALIVGVRHPASMGRNLAGYRHGWATRIGPRRPIKWRTVWRLTRLGRPPIV